jgi:hypothetical protein
LPRLFAHSLAATESKLGACLELVSWSHDERNARELEDLLFSWAQESLRIDLKRDKEGILVSLVARGPLGNEIAVSTAHLGFEWRGEEGERLTPPERETQPRRTRRSGPAPPRQAMPRRNSPASPSRAEPSLVTPRHAATA